jgi:MFS family permease
MNPMPEDAPDIPSPVPLSEEGMVTSSGRVILGLSGRLWRLAIVVGVAQFSMSLWSWQFGIFMQDVLTDPLQMQMQMGLTYSSGTLATLAGYLASGSVSDAFGRRLTMAFSLIPIFLGLTLLYQMPVWPLIPFSFGLTAFGWSFVLIISRAVPADEIATSGQPDAPRKFMMVVMPAYLVDGICPIIAATLLREGYEPRFLFFLGSIAALVALVGTLVAVKETLSSDNQRKAKAKFIASPRSLGAHFWKFAVGMVGFYFVWYLSISYLGLLCVNEWGVDRVTFGYTWSVSSLSTAVVSYSASGLTSHSTRASLVFALAADALIIGAFSYGSGVPMMFLLNVLWAVPIVLWISAERTLVVEGVSPEMKGRALGTWQFLMSSMGVFAAPAGATIWMLTGSLRSLWRIACVLGLLSIIPTVIALKWMGKTVKETGSDTDGTSAAAIDK